MTHVTETSEGPVTEGGRRTPWLLIGGGVGAVVLVGGGVAAAVMLAGGGERPDSVLPQNAAVYMQIDLDPSVGQKISAVRFFQGLDAEMDERLSDGEWREWAWEQIEAEGDVPADVTFSEDIEPWLGDRAGMAVLPAGEGEEPAMAVALQVKDGDAALAFLDEQMESSENEVGYYLESDYVVFSHVDTLEAVRSAAESGTLADNDTYTSDMSDLGEAGVMAMWADLSQADELSASALNPSMQMTQEEFGLSDEELEVEGRVAATVRLAPDAIEVHGVSRGIEGIAAPAAERTALISQLPADTAVALSVENGAETVQSAWDFYAQTYGEQLQEAADEAAAAGFNLPDDIKAVLGESMVLSAGPGIVDAAMNISGTDPNVPELPLAYRATTDTDRVMELLNSNGLGAGVLVTRTDEGTLTLGSDQAYVDALADGPADVLGDSPLFSSAVADADEAQMALYVDVAPFEQYYLPEVTDETARASLEKLAAIGMSSVVEDESSGHFTLRVVADQE